MKCNEIRNLALAYLDSELDAKTSQEVHLHLQTCAECAQLVEQEEKFNAQLFGVLREGQWTPALWEKVESRLSPRRTFADFFRRWKAAVLGAVAVLVIGGLAAGTVRFISVTRPFDLAQAVAKDHREFIEGKMTPEFTGALPGKVAEAVRGRLDAAAFSIIPKAEGFHSEGARLCNLAGVPAAWTMGRCGDVPVSFIVFKRSDLNHFPKAQQRLASGEPIVCARCGRFQFAVRLAGGHVICAMAAMSKQVLEELLKSAAEAG